MLASDFLSKSSSVIGTSWEGRNGAWQGDVPRVQLAACALAGILRGQPVTVTNPLWYLTFYTRMETTAIDAQNSCKLAFQTGLHFSCTGELHWSDTSAAPCAFPNCRVVSWSCSSSTSYTPGEISIYFWILNTNWVHRPGFFYCATSGKNFRNAEVFKPYSCTWVTLCTWCFSELKPSTKWTVAHFISFNTLLKDSYFEKRQTKRKSNLLLLCFIRFSEIAERKASFINLCTRCRIA